MCWTAAQSIAIGVCCIEWLCLQSMLYSLYLTVILHSIFVYGLLSDFINVDLDKIHKKNGIALCYILYKFTVCNNIGGDICVPKWYVYQIWIDRIFITHPRLCTIIFFYSFSIFVPLLCTIWTTVYHVMVIFVAKLKTIFTFLVFEGPQKTTLSQT